jgi:microcystin-dependent protein
MNASTAAAATPNSFALGAGNFLASPTVNIYGAALTETGLNPAALSNTGGSQAHENRQPFLTINFVIALQGIFPSQS